MVLELKWRTTKMSTTKFDIEKFDEKNDFRLWKMKMESILIH